MASIGPGPIYSLPPTVGYEKHDQRKPRMPQYSMRGLTKDINKSMTPGPSYNVSGCTQYGPGKPKAFTMAPRTFVDAKNIGPGPANYDLNKTNYANTSRPPSYSMAQRTSIPNKNFCPGPNAYGVTIKSNAPAYSIGMRTTLKSKGLSPGAAAYLPNSPKTYLKRAPEYSMGARTKPVEKLIGPGANYYNNMNHKPGKSSPAYSFGLRHSEKAPPFITACDKMP